MKEWSANHIQEYLDEWIRLEGRGDASELSCCPSCTPADMNREGPVYGCSDCAGFLMECRTCSIRRHERLPLHTVKVRCKTISLSHLHLYTFAIYRSLFIFVYLHLTRKSGTEIFSRTPHCEQWVFAISSGTSISTAIFLPRLWSTLP